MNQFVSRRSHWTWNTALKLLTILKNRAISNVQNLNQAGNNTQRKTKDILHVKEMLGHQSIDNTLIYTQLINFERDDYHVRIAKTLKEDKELIEAGSEYVTDRDGVKIYRKRK